MIDISTANIHAQNLRNQASILSQSRNELLAYKNAIASNYYAGETTALLNKIDQALRTIDDTIAKINTLASSVSNTASQIRREEEAEAERIRQEQLARERERQRQLERQRQQAQQQERQQRYQQADNDFKASVNRYNDINKQIQELLKKISKAKLTDLPKLAEKMSSLTAQKEEAEKLMNQARAVRDSLR